MHLEYLETTVGFHTLRVVFLNVQHFAELDNTYYHEFWFHKLFLSMAFKQWLTLKLSLVPLICFHRSTHFARVSRNSRVRDQDFDSLTGFTFPSTFLLGTHPFRASERAEGIEYLYELITLHRDNSEVSHPPWALFDDFRRVIPSLRLWGCHDRKDLDEMMQRLPAIETRGYLTFSSLLTNERGCRILAIWALCR